MEIRGAVVFEKSGEFSIEPLQLSDPNDDEVLVRVCGVPAAPAGTRTRLPRPTQRSVRNSSSHQGSPRRALLVEAACVDERPHCL